MPSRFVVLTVTRLITSIVLTLAFLLNIDRAVSSDAFDPRRLEKEVLVAACEDPMQLEVLRDGRVLFIERNGSVKLRLPQTGEIKTLGVVAAQVFGEVGLLGLATDRDYENTGWIYLFYCPKQQRETLRLSRFTVKEDSLDLQSEVQLLDYKFDAQGANHMGGGLCMDSHGNLLVGTGDNCMPIPELPVDWRPDRSHLDAMRTSANSMDLRGKVLRVHPEPNGTYSVPTGNLFADPRAGRPEIYAMGCRNAFRVTADEQDGCVYWGDVGPNIQLDLNVGPNGYDEINRAPTAGNFGWPMFVGPNEPYRLFDFTTRTAGPQFDVQAPLNSSPNNTGARALPPPLPALIWYPSGTSPEFPELGSGGRSAIAGPVYRAERYAGSDLALPSEFDGALFIYDWTRNWLCTVHVNAVGKVETIRRFFPDAAFRKPIDMECGPEGALYVIEYGDRWVDNKDAQIVRIVYRRGNRPPRAALAVEPSAGRHPLTVELNASASTDPDGENGLSYAYEINGRVESGETGTRRHFTFDKPGHYQVAVSVTDAAGASSRVVRDVRVGNARPSIRIVSPAHGSFIDWGQTVRYRIEAADLEDGATSDGTIPARKVTLSRQFQLRRRSQQTDATGKPVEGVALDPGLHLISRTTCFSCHTMKSPSAGPPYRDVGRKYAGDADARERLANKIITGGTGAWGSKPMPPHPQHSLQETRLMVDWILSLAADDSPPSVAGTRGFFHADRPASAAHQSSGALVLGAEYLDAGIPGVAGVNPISAQTECVLHSRRQRAAFFDQRSGAELVDVFERQAGLIMRFAPGDWIAFEDMNLADIDRVIWKAAASGGERGSFSLRLDAPDGPELAAIPLHSDADQLGEIFREQTTALEDPGGLHNLFVVAADKSGSASGGENSKPYSLAWLEFLDSAGAIARKQAEDESIRKVVLIPTKLDHPWSTHMYADVCRILADCLNQTPGVEAVVSPELDWPKDDRLLKDVDAVVFYSRPAGDIVLSPAHRKEADELLKRRVGFTAIHWATAAEKNVGDDYQKILGGWFNFAFSGLKIDRQPLKQLAPGHPICRGWTGYELRDEFYTNLRFHPDATPILNVEVDQRDQTVAWVYERPDGGRSFGTTLGHFHENYGVEAFRRMLVNGILWTARIEVPATGAPVAIGPESLEPSQPPRALVRDWKFEDLQPHIHRPSARSSFAQGASLFQTASCIACHRLQGIGGQIGPDLTEVSRRMARYDNPRAALLREILEPSHVIDEKYRAQIFALKNGTVVSGIVLGESDGIVRLATNPAKPDEQLQLSAEEVEERKTSPISMMPPGLLNTFQVKEILDLFAYVESGGNPRSEIYSSK